MLSCTTNVLCQSAILSYHAPSLWSSDTLCFHACFCPQLKSHLMIKTKQEYFSLNSDFFSYTVKQETTQITVSQEFWRIWERYMKNPIRDRVAARPSDVAPSHFYNLWVYLNDAVLFVSTVSKGNPEISSTAWDESTLGVKHTENSCLSRCIAITHFQRLLLLQKSVNMLYHQNSAGVMMCYWQDGSSYKKSTSTSRAHLTTGGQQTHSSFGWPSRNDTAKSAALFLAIKNGKSCMHKDKG